MTQLGLLACKSRDSVNDAKRDTTGQIIIGYEKIYFVQDWTSLLNISNRKIETESENATFDIYGKTIRWKCSNEKGISISTLVVVLVALLNLMPLYRLCYKESSVLCRDPTSTCKSPKVICAITSVAINKIVIP